jgi:phosphoribosylaminoimidazole-succinocarboxamide synthase
MKRIHVGSGSVKEIYRDDVPGTLLFEHSNRFSVFDVGRHPQEIPGMGKALCDATEHSFRLAHTLGINTHYLERIDNLTIRVKEVQVITERDCTPDDRNYALPLEWIVRERVGGSIERAFRNGKKKPRDYGFPTDDPPAAGTPFPWPVCHFTTKREDIDRDLTPDEALALAGITPREAENIWRMMMRFRGGLALAFAKAGFELWDGKFEMALGPDREPMLIDSAGTQNEDRPVERDVSGVFWHYSKEVIRQLFIDNGYFEKLSKARANNEPDPAYPNLTEAEISMISTRYRDFADRFTSVHLS